MQPRPMKGNRMNNFMNDRYGADDLTLALGGAGMVLALIGSIAQLRILSIIALVVLIGALVRCFSKNFDARRRENEAFRSLMARIPVIGERFGGSAGASTRPRQNRSAATDDLKRQARTAKKMWKERKTKAFLKCPNCGTMLSVPRGKGKIIVTCPKCHARMETKS